LVAEPARCLLKYSVDVVMSGGFTFGMFVRPEHVCASRLVERIKRPSEYRDSKSSYYAALRAGQRETLKEADAA
jgi:hypothetical protein